MKQRPITSKREHATTIRPATIDDREALRAMQALSMCVLAVGFYSPEEIAGFINHVGTMDDFLLHEGTYYVVTHREEIVASGGWSRLKPNYANATISVDRAKLNTDLPKVRSLFVHPAFARRRLASRLMERAEGEAWAAGFDTVELTATLSGVPLYNQRGYIKTGKITLDLPGGASITGVTMRKCLVDVCGTKATAI